MAQNKGPQMGKLDKAIETRPKTTTNKSEKGHRNDNDGPNKGALDGKTRQTNKNKAQNYDK